MAKFQVLVFVLVILAGKSLGANDILRKVIAKSCSSTYTMGCFKMDMIHLVDLLEDARNYRLLPGVEITKDNSTQEGEGGRKLPEKLVRSLARNFPHGDSSDLDEYLIGRVTEYLGTHSLSLSLGSAAGERDQNGESSIESAGRKGGGGGGGGGKGGYGGLIAAAMMMKGMLATLGMGALAALAGKALMTGLMSLMLSAIIGLKSATGGGHKSTTYEIISKPVYSHSHSHSSEVQHDHGGGGGGGGGHAAYTYGRNLDLTEAKKKGEKVTHTSEVQYVTLDGKDEEEEGEQVEYKTISEEDLKEMQKYGSYYANNLDYAAHDQGQGGYRSAKALDTQQPLPPLLNLGKQIEQIGRTITVIAMTIKTMVTHQTTRSRTDNPKMNGTYVLPPRTMQKS